MDDSPFREFQIECIGDTIGFKRLTRLRIQKRLENGLPIVYRYKPDDDHNTLSAEYKFPNDAGTLKKK